MLPDQILFDPKKITVTPEVRSKLNELEESITALLRRHIRGDRGVLSKEELDPLQDSDVMLSLYRLRDGSKLLVRTTSDLETILTLYYEDHYNGEMEDESS